MLINGSLEALPSVDVGTSLNPKCSSSFRTPGLRLGTALAVDLPWETSWHCSWHSWDLWHCCIPIPLPFFGGKFTSLPKEKHKILQLSRCQTELRAAPGWKEGKKLIKNRKKGSGPVQGSVLGIRDVGGESRAHPSRSKDS